MRHKIIRTIALVGAVLVPIADVVVMRNDIPLFARKPRAAALTACPMFLATLQGAKWTWALENKKEGRATPTWDDIVGPDRYIRTMPTCPEHGTYTLGPVDVPVKCSIGPPGHALNADGSTPR